MAAYHGSPLAKVAFHDINSKAMYKIHNSVFSQFNEEMIKQFSLPSKLSKLYLKGRFNVGNWFRQICSMTNLT
jgi:hypothetical protein